MTPTRTRSALARSTAARPRRGVTLIEMLVVIAIIAGLSLLALMLLPAISNSDKVLKGTEEVRSTCKVAQALAAGSRQPRGVRFLVAPDPVTGLPRQPGNRFATEMQLLESPPVAVLDPRALVTDYRLGVQNGLPDAGRSDVPGGARAGRLGVSGGNNGVDTSSAPCVELVYDLYTGQPSDPSIDPQHFDLPTAQRPVPPAGALKLRHCYLRNLSADQLAQVTPGAMLVLPTLGAWSRINQVQPYTLLSPAKQPIYSAPNAATPPGAVEIQLDFYPDQAMGASTAFRTYHAGIYGPPVPLLGQPTIPLPKDVAVDLDISSPAVVAAASGAVPNYDIMFAPDGQTISVAGRSTNTGIYLWLRDFTKVTNPTGTVQNSMRPNDFAGYPTLATYGPAWATAFRLGGEHHVVGINNGYIGTAPIQWPDAAGTYAAGNDPFTFARKKLN